MIVSIDLETTGLGCQWEWDRYRYVGICSIGYAYQVGDEIKSGCQLLQLPEGIHIEPGAAKVNGFTAEKLRLEGRDYVGALNSFAAWIATADLIVGQNILGFDWPILLRNILRARGTIETDFELPHATEGRIFDTKLAWKANECKMAQRQSDEPLPRFWNRIEYQRAPGVKTGLDAILAKIGITARTGYHTAGDDALLTLKVFQWMQREGIVAQIMGA